MDEEVVADLGAAGGYAVHTLTDQTRDIPKAEWDRERVGYLCVNSTAFNDAQTALDQLCQETNLCDYQTRDAIQKASLRIHSALRKAKK